MPNVAPRNGLLLDQDHNVLLRLRGQKFRSYADTFGPPLMLAGQYLANVAGNAMRRAAGELRVNSGLQYLIGAFYRSIREEAPVPFHIRKSCGRRGSWIGYSSSSARRGRRTWNMNDPHALKVA
jgi:hypothetical protein